jgi:acetamidase/formamidase
MLHTIPLNRSTLHGHFSRDLPPILTINSGDTVRLSTLDAAWCVEPPLANGDHGKKFEPRDPELDKGHALTGPIAIKGARPGMTVEVHIDTLRPGSFGWNSAGGWYSLLNHRLGVDDGPEERIAWELDTEKMIGRNQYGHQVTLRPHLGVIGMPSAPPGVHSTIPPRNCGGNMDCKELGMGASVFLPVAVEGGLLSVGDGHALMADGESSSTGIECPMDLVQLTITLHPKLFINTPRALTPAAWITLGFNEDLDEASAVALDAMLDLMEEQYDLSRLKALALASLVVDLRVSQLVNGVRGVHAVLPHGAIR